MPSYTETKLWKKFEGKSTDEQRHPINEMMKRGGQLLTKIGDTFPTYTLHDEQHACNVINRMCDLLGDSIDTLSSLEMAILLLSAYFHDIGMVFTPEDRRTIDTTPDYQDFLRKNPRALVIIADHKGDTIPDNVVEWFCRWSHPQRANQHLCEESIRWGSVNITQAVGLVCESHGYDPSTLLNPEFATKYLDQADLRFCAILLRLADILDFDNTRTPDEIYKYLGLSDSNRSDSNHEWRKHFASDGFRFPNPNSRQDNYELSFIASPDHPAVEDDIRKFLDTIESEIAQCRKLLESCNPRWQSLKFPRLINREHIHSDGYEFGEYRFTLEQDQILNLLMGENLYDDPYAFVRELVQNAIDASRHRQFYEQANGDPNFKPEPINLTTWTDRDGYVWMRIDDYGMGMDEDIIRNYFLRVGRSYYQSDQFKADKLKYHQFTPISRFGIGVLSCFIIGDKLEVSTKRRNNNEDSNNAIRLTMNGLETFYVVRLQKSKHNPELMPNQKSNSETYRNRGKYGTSIAIRLKASQYHDKDWLKDTLEKYLFAPPVPVLLNGEVIAISNDDIIEKPLVEAWEYEFTSYEIRRIELQLGMELTSPPQLKLVPINLAEYSPFPKLLRGQAILANFKLHPSDINEALRKKIYANFYESIRISIDEDKKLLGVTIGSWWGKPGLPPI